MKQTSKLILIASCIFAISITSCKKAKTKTDYLTSKAWKISKAESIISPSTTWSASTISSCGLDNTLTFNTDKTLIFDEGALKCNASDPQTQSGTWTFDSNEANITITVSGNTTVFALPILDANTLALQDNSGAPDYEKYTYVH